MPGCVLSLCAILLCSTALLPQTNNSDQSEQSQVAPQAQSLPEVITPAEKQAREQAVVELVETQMPRERFSQYMQAVTAQVIAHEQARAVRSGTSMPPEELGKLKRTMASVVSYDEIVRSEAEIYSSHFTVDEIHQLRDFYRTPVGAKLVRLEPVIAEQAMARMFATVDQRVQAAMEKQDNPDSEQH